MSTSSSGGSSSLGGVKPGEEVPSRAKAESFSRSFQMSRGVVVAQGASGSGDARPEDEGDSGMVGSGGWGQ